MAFHLSRLALVLGHILDIVFPESIKAYDFLIRERTLHSRGNSHDQGAWRDNCARRNQRARGDQRLRTNASVIQHNRTDTNQRATLNITAVQSDAVAHRNLVFKNRWM